MRIYFFCFHNLSYQAPNFNKAQYTKIVIAAVSRRLYKKIQSTKEMVRWAISEEHKNSRGALFLRKRGQQTKERCKKILLFSKYTPPPPGQIIKNVSHFVSNEKITHGFFNTKVLSVCPAIVLHVVYNLLVFLLRAKLRFHISGGGWR